LISISAIKIVALAGGVGGAKLAHGLAQCLPPENLTVIVNVGDDFDHLGLRICPDLDTVCYTLAGIANPVTGWGRADESWNVFEEVKRLGGPSWFQLGDRDLSTHLERTRRLHAGQPLSQITQGFCQSWGVNLTVLPTTDDFTPTWVYTDNGELPFQEYFVRRQCQPRVSGFRFEGVEHARPAPGVLETLRSAEIVFICPSNPWVSIDPILAIPGIREALTPKPGNDQGISTREINDHATVKRVVVAVSPIIGGKTVKGPAAKMYAELGIQPSALAVARHYGSLLTGFVMDTVDTAQAGAVQALGIRTLTTNTLMPTPDERRRLAQEALDFGRQLLA
jgi:LPPG:FO 2-phospho-L-lactate transferase